MHACMATYIYISCIFQRILSANRRNWTHSARELLQSMHQSNCMPTPDNLHNLDYYYWSLGYLFLNHWRIKIKESGPDSESWGRLKLYREVKEAPSTERYVANIRTVGGGGEGGE